MEPDNPYTVLEGYEVRDAAGNEVGEVEQTIYDAPSDVLKYVIVAGRPVPADRMEVDPERERVLVPYDRDAIESAPQLGGRLTGDLDAAVREHYGEI